MRLLVLGGHGRLGSRVVATLRARERRVVALGRDADPGSVEAGDVVANLATSDPDVVRSWARAGGAAAGYLDVVPTEASHVALEGIAGFAAPVLPGVGFVGAVGDALAVVAAAARPGAVRADVTVYVPARRSLLAGATPRERADLLSAVLTPMQVLVDGRVVDERIAEDRRLAWFPRPVGPHHAAAVPGTHWRTVPAVLPGLRTVRSALALRSSSAEVLQGMGNAARFEPVAARVRRRAGRSGRDAGTVGERWAVVVEVVDERGGLARGWAYGLDRHTLTVEVAALLAGRLADGVVGVRGVAGATEVVGAADLLDELAARTDLRWSVTAS